MQRYTFLESLENIQQQLFTWIACKLQSILQGFSEVQDKFQPNNNKHFNKMIWSKVVEFCNGLMIVFYFFFLCFNFTCCDTFWILNFISFQKFKLFHCPLSWLTLIWIWVVKVNLTHKLLVKKKKKKGWRGEDSDQLSTKGDCSFRRTSPI